MVQKCKGKDGHNGWKDGEISAEKWELYLKEDENEKDH